MNKYLLLLSLVLTPFFSSAYIMPTRTILQKTTENSGSGIFAIEQEVQFNVGDETLHTRETWLIDSDKNMRVTIVGSKDLQNTFKLQFIYTGGQKWSLVNGTKKSERIPEDFLEKYFNFRSGEQLAATLAHLKIIPGNAFNRKSLPKTGAEIKYEPESWVRYSRAGGVPNYAFGTPTPEGDSTNNAGIWIEQDQFVIRKLRLPSQVEILADSYNDFAKGLKYPKLRTVRWGNNTATIRLISASARPNTAISLLQPTSLDISKKVDGLEKSTAREVINEFYMRFR